MTTISEVPGSLEALEIVVTGIKITPNGRPIKNACGEKGLFFQVSVERGQCTGEITKEFEILKQKCHQDSVLTAGSKVFGRDLWGMSLTPVKGVIVGGSGRSGRHPGQEFTMKKHCYLILIHGFRGDAIASHPSKSISKESPNQVE